MRRAQQPSKLLNSEAICGAALCYTSPVVSGQCSIISAKCVFNVKEKDLSKSWNHICTKRDLCDREISGSTQLLVALEILKLSFMTLKNNFDWSFSGIPNAAFFFSAVATQEKKKGSIEESDDSDDDGERSPVPSTQSEQMVNGNPTVVNKSLWPAINYWLALTTPNGAPANPLIVHRAVLKCGVAVTANQVSYARMISAMTRTWHAPFKHDTHIIFLFQVQFQDGYQGTLQNVEIPQEPLHAGTCDCVVPVQLSWRVPKS